MSEYADFCEMMGGSAGDPDFLDLFLAQIGAQDDFSSDDPDIPSSDPGRNPNKIEW